MFGIKLQQGRAGLDFRQHFLRVDTMEQWDRLLGKAQISTTRGLREQFNQYLSRVVLPWGRRMNFCRSLPALF